jgi:hypothetical protein
MNFKGPSKQVAAANGTARNVVLQTLSASDLIVVQFEDCRASAAKSLISNSVATAAVNHCATQNQV